MSDAVTPATTNREEDQHRCLNCGSVLLGDHCYQCGQPVKGLIRQFSSVIGDFLDTVFNLDSRTIRTLKPLLFQPGFLSTEYFAGRRVSYVTPLRLYIFFSVLAFFAIHASIETDDLQVKPVEPGKGAVQIDAGSDLQFLKAMESGDEAQVRRAAAQARAEIAEARETLGAVPGMGGTFDDAVRDIDRMERERLAAIAAKGDAKSADVKAPTPPAPAAPATANTAADDAEGSEESRNNGFNFPVDGKPWHPTDNPLKLDWAPDFFDNWLNRKMGRADKVLERDDAERTLVEALFGALPQTLLLMLPLFAVLLKIMYLFKKRFYMEHLIVALHSHAFIALALSVLVVLIWLEDWLASFSGVLAGGVSFLIAGCVVWIPLYLLLMQKRVYGQGWLMTLFKYFITGFIYLIMLSLGLAFALIFGLLSL